jgi:hypothetical protein
MPVDIFKVGQVRRCCREGIYEKFKVLYCQGGSMSARNWLFFVILAMVILLVGRTCFASDDGDFQFWSKARVYFDIDKDWGFSFEEEFKFGENAGNLYSHHSDFGFEYKSFADWVDFGFYYRQAYEKDSEDKWREEHRPHLDVTLKGKLFDLGLSDRSRLEYRDREKAKDVWRYRNKVKATLPVELTRFKLKPYVADEVFFNVDAKGYYRNRLYGGVTFGLSKDVKGDVYYLWQSSRSGGDWEEINALGATLKFYF